MEARGEHTCISCGRDSRQTPLLAFEYQDRQFWMCPEHLPVLVHDPAQLVGKIPGAETFRPSEHHD